MREFMLDDLRRTNFIFCFRFVVQQQKIFPACENSKTDRSHIWGTNRYAKKKIAMPVGKYLIVGTIIGGRHR